MKNADHIAVLNQYKVSHQAQYENICFFYIIQKFDSILRFAIFFRIFFICQPHSLR